MKLIISRYVLLFIVIFAMAGAFFSRVSPLAHAASATGKPVLYIVGDSTVHNPQKKLNQCGWGDVIDAGFDLSKIEVKNVARGGRSSRSFIEEGLWEKEVLNHLKSGDFVFVQFGHNDGGGFKDPKSATRASLRRRGGRNPVVGGPATSQ